MKMENTNSVNNSEIARGNLKNDVYSEYDKKIGKLMLFII
jgi:hypothetical protein